MLPTHKTQSICIKLNIFYFQLIVKTKHKECKKVTLHQFVNLNTSDLFILTDLRGLDSTFVQFLQKTLPLFTQIIQSNQYSALKAFLFYTQLGFTKQRKFVRRKKCFFFKTRQPLTKKLAKLQTEPATVLSFWVATFSSLNKKQSIQPNYSLKIKAQRLKLKKYLYIISKLSVRRCFRLRAKTPRNWYSSKLLFYRKNLKARHFKYKNARNRVFMLSTWAAHNTGRKRLTKSVVKYKAGNFLKTRLSQPGVRSAHEDLRIVREAEQRKKLSTNLKWARRLRKKYRKKAKLRFLVKINARRAHWFYIKNRKSAILKPTNVGKRAAALNQFQGWNVELFGEQTPTKKKSLFVMMHEERERLKKLNSGSSVSIAYVSPAQFNPNVFSTHARIAPFNQLLYKECINSQAATISNKKFSTQSIFSSVVQQNIRSPKQQQVRDEFSFFTKTSKKNWSLSARYKLFKAAPTFFVRPKRKISTLSSVRSATVAFFLNTSFSNVYKTRRLYSTLKTLSSKPSYLQVINNILVYLTQRKTVNFLFLKKRKHLFQLFFYWLTGVMGFYGFKIKNKKMFQSAKKLKNLSNSKKKTYIALKKKLKIPQLPASELVQRTKVCNRKGSVYKGGLFLETRKNTAPNNQTPIRLNHAFLLFFSRVSKYYRRKLFNFKTKLKKTQRRYLKILQKLKKKIKRNRRQVWYAKHRKSLARLNKVHKDKRIIKNALRVLPFKIRKSLYTKTMPVLKKTKPNFTKKPAIVKRVKLLKRRTLISTYKRRSLWASMMAKRRTLLYLIGSKASKYKASGVFNKKTSKSLINAKSRLCKLFFIRHDRSHSKDSLLSINLQQGGYSAMRPKLLRKPRLLKYLKSLLKNSRRKFSTFRSRLKTLYFRHARRPTYRKLLRRPWKIQWKRLTSNFGKKNFKLKKHLLRSMRRSTFKSHFFSVSEKQKKPTKRALKYRYILTRLRRNAVENSNNLSISSSLQQQLTVQKNSKQFISGLVNLSSSKKSTFARLHGVVSPRLLSFTKRRVYRALKVIFPFPVGKAKQHKLRWNYNVPLTRKKPKVNIIPQKHYTYAIGFKPQTPVLVKSKRGGRIVFSLTAKTLKKNKIRHKLKQLRFKNLKFKFLNFFVLNFFSYKNTNHSFEQFVKYRVASRGWPMPKKDLRRDGKKRAMRLKTRINFIKVLKKGYIHNPVKNTKDKFLFADVNESKKTYKFFTKKHTAQLALADKQYSKEKALSNRNNLQDFTRHFLKTLWSAQNMFRKTIRKGNALNRWRFKKKFWEWFRNTRGVRNYKPDVVASFPHIQTLLIKLGIVSTKSAFLNLLRIGLVKYNNADFKLHTYKPSIGDFVSLPAFTSHIKKANRRRVRDAKRKLKKSQRKHQLIVKSQWRQKKKVRQSMHKLFQRFKYGAVPSWLEFDFFTSCFAFIKYPHNLMYRKSDTQVSPMLLKLTPWRLKV